MKKMPNDLSYPVRISYVGNFDKTCSMWFADCKPGRLIDINYFTIRFSICLWDAIVYYDLNGFTDPGIAKRYIHNRLRWIG